MSLHPVDLAIIAVYLFLMAMVGFIIKNRATKKIESYFLADRNVPWWMLGLAGCSSYIDIGGTMSMVGILFYLGLKSLWATHIFWGWFIICFYMAFQAKWIRRSGVMTFAEWNETRFGATRDAEAARMAAAPFNRRLQARPGVSLPITVLNTNPSLTRVPVEVEFMADYRPFWKGQWHLRALGWDGREIPSQEEQPESLLPFNWRKRLCFMAQLPGLGAAHFEAKVYPGKKKPQSASLDDPDIDYKIDRRKGMIAALRARNSGELLRGPLLEPLVIKDEGDSWGTGCWSYRAAAGQDLFKPLIGSRPLG